MKYLVLCLVLFMVGCAKLPDAGIGPTTTRLVFEITTDQPINPNFIYMVAINPSTDEVPTTQGPIPVIAPPWGNGFVAGDVKYFVKWSSDQSPKYQLYTFRDVALLDYRPIGVPVSYVDPTSTEKKLKFELDLTQIAGSAAEADTYKSLQINILTMDRIPQGSTGSKNWEALGDGRLASEINTPITIPLRTAGTYNNIRFSNLEPQGDIDDPTLDIVDFTIQVSPQQ